MPTPYPYGRFPFFLQFIHSLNKTTQRSRADQGVAKRPVRLTFFMNLDPFLCDHESPVNPKVRFQSCEVTLDFTEADASVDMGVSPGAFQVG